VLDPTATRAQLFANVADEFVAYDFATVIWHRPLLNILFGEEVIDFLLERSRFGLSRSRFW
jgi:hypothetical protein